VISLEIEPIFWMDLVPSDSKLGPIGLVLGPRNISDGKITEQFLRSFWIDALGPKMVLARGH